MSSKLRTRPKIRRVCRKCGARLVNKPEYGAVCPECGWHRKSYVDRDDEAELVRTHWDDIVR